MVITIALFFDPLGSSSKSNDDIDYERFETGLRSTKNTKLWERRCRVLMCSCMGNDEMSRDAFKELGSKSLNDLNINYYCISKYKLLVDYLLFSEIMSLLFEDINLVPSDLAAGLIILNLKSKAEAERRNLEGIRVEGDSDDTEPFPVTSEPNYTQNYKFNMSVASSIVVLNDPWNTPQRVSHFMKYALGSYGWPWFLVAHMKSGLCRLWENILCCGCCV